MNRWQQQVLEFHEATDSTVGGSIKIRDRELRAKLMMEELAETIGAMGFAFDAGFRRRQGGSPGIHRRPV
jgi:hypothetical protein